MNFNSIHVDITLKDVVEKFEALYAQQPLVVRAPGRINLIGEHTDYNNGFVMPAAIDKETVFAMQASPDHVSVIYSIKYDEFFTVDLNDPQPVKSPLWANYLLGVLRQLIDRGHTIKPFRCVFGGNIPLGAGLSSSAALECGFAFALNELNQLHIPKTELARIAQWSEHNFIGVKCGIMDQFASLMGKEDHVILLDCRSLSYKLFPLQLRGYSLVLVDTHVKHSLVDSEYNTRRAECEKGVEILRQYYPEVNSLRDASETMVRKHRSEMTGKVFDRCLYIVQEIARVQLASTYLEKHDLMTFGKCMFETHEGLSKLYQVSCKELDFLVEHAQQIPGVIGARMMGGGFGGCTINLVADEVLGTFQQQITQAYYNAFAIHTEPLVVKVMDGVGVSGSSIPKNALL